MGICIELLENNQLKTLYLALVLVLVVLMIMQLWKFGYYMERFWNPTPGPITGHTHDDDYPIGKHYLGGSLEIYPDAKNVVNTSSVTGGAAVDYIGTGGANMRHAQLNTDPGTGEDFDHMYHFLHQDFGGFRGEITDASRA